MANKDLELEQLKLGEIDRSALLKKYNESDASLDSQLESLASSDEEILKAYPSDKMKAAVLEKLQATKNGKSDEGQDKSKYIIKMPLRNFLRTKQFAAVAAAVIFCAVLIPLQTVGNKGSYSATENTGIRVKGSSNPSLFLYKNEEGNVVKLSDHQKIKEGEVVQISYISGKANYGMIFSIDGNGVLTQHFPEQKAVSGELEHGKEVALDFSYELDNAPRFEKFYFVTSEKPFEASDLDISLSTGKVESNGQSKLDVAEFYLEK